MMDSSRATWASCSSSMSPFSVFSYYYHHPSIRVSNISNKTNLQPSFVNPDEQWQVAS
jgi:hypothetical protein